MFLVAWIRSAHVIQVRLREIPPDSRAAHRVKLTLCQLDLVGHRRPRHIDLAVEVVRLAPGGFAEAVVVAVSDGFHRRNHMPIRLSLSSPSKHRENMLIPEI